MSAARIVRAATPSELLEALVASDPGTPRLTWYDDAEGSTQGERIELSARVLANWTAKSANLLVDELDVGPGDAVDIDLPVHWRAVYWALAAWAAGADLRFGDGSSQGPVADVLITHRPPERPKASRVVAVSLPALARRWVGDPLPGGVLDEATEVGPQPDVFIPAEAPDGADPLTRARALAAESGWQDGERVALELPSSHGLGDLLVAVLAAWSVDGSVVLVRDPDPAAAPARLAAERVTSAYVPGDTPAPRS